MKKLIALTVLSALASGSMYAEKPSFNFVEGGYVDFDESDGFGIRGNFELNKNFFLEGEYTTVTEEDALFGDEEFKSIVLGIGYKMELNETTDAYTRLAYEDLEFDYGQTVSSDGYQLGLGIRSQISLVTQLYGEVTNRNMDFDGGEKYTLTELKVGVRQNFTDTFGMYIEANANDRDGDGYSIGLTAHF